MVLPAETIWRDFTTDGVPTSGVWKPKKSEIREQQKWLESAVNAGLSNGGLIYDTRANMNLDLNHDPHSSAWVVGDATASNNGIYQKTGASGSGSWVRFADLPYSFIRLSDVGAGTANAIQVTSSIPTSASVLRIANVFEANTGNITISENGGAAKSLLTNSGNQIAPGGLTSGMMIIYVDDGFSFRLLYDQVSASIVAAAEAAQAAAEDARDAALAAVSSVVPNTFANKAAAASYSPTVAPDFLSLAGYGASGDGGAALYKKVASEPSHSGKFSITLQSAAVVWYEVAENVLRPEMFGAVGDDVADDTAEWQTAALLAAGKRLEGRPGKTYNLTASIILGDGTHLDLSESRLNFRISGAVYCIRAGNDCVVENGHIKNYGTGGMGVTGDYQCPVVMGQFAANVPVENVQLRNLTIESDWTDGNGLFVTSSSNNILIENIIFPNSGMYCPIEAHWGGSPSGTGHPHNIVIRNVKCGNINPAGFLISLSAAYNVLVENVEGGTCYYAFHNYAGDYTNMYAPAAVKPLVGKNIIARNFSVTDVRNTGAWVDGQSFNPNIVSPATQPLEMNGIIENCRFYGAGAIAQSPEPTAPYGAKIANCRDLEIRNNHFEWFTYGVVPAGPTERVYLVGNNIRGCSNVAIVASLLASPPTDWVIERNVCQGNNRNAFTTSEGAAIQVGASFNCKVIGNRIGFGGSEFSYYGVFVSTGAVSPVLRDNWVNKLAAGGVAYSVGNVSSYNINASGSNNRAGSGVALWGGTTLLNDNGLGFREGIAVEGSAPTVGTWAVGDRLWSKVPTSTVVGHVCTAAGTPGTWRAFGT